MRILISTPYHKQYKAVRTETALLLAEWETRLQNHLEKFWLSKEIEIIMYDGDDQLKSDSRKGYGKFFKDNYVRIEEITKLNRMSGTKKVRFKNVKNLDCVIVCSPAIADYPDGLTKRTCITKRQYTDVKFAIDHDIPVMYLGSSEVFMGVNKVDRFASDLSVDWEYGWVEIMGSTWSQKDQKWKQKLDSWVTLFHDLSNMYTSNDGQPHCKPIHKKPSAFNMIKIEDSTKEYFNMHKAQAARPAYKTYLIAQELGII